jgi:mannobiose 2-epimerase
MLFIMTLISSCHAAPVPPTDIKNILNPEYWKAQAVNDLIPFWENTIDRDNGGFFTNVNEDGTLGASSNKYTRMNSRVVFGFCAAYLLTGDDKYLEFAKHGMDFLSQYCWDKYNGGWSTNVDEENEPDSGGKNLFDETYGSLGPVMYYYTTGDKNALSLVKKNHDLMQSKAWDKEFGGYYAWVGPKWETVTSTKSFNSEIDTCTAYLIYYYMATKDPQLLADLKAIGDMVILHMMDPKTNFIGETFNRDWTWSQNNLWVGHNLKTGWVLMRIYNLTGDKKYLDAAEKIAVAQIKYTWDKKYHGWLFHFTADDPSVTDDAKDWWTQEEGNNLMLNLYPLSGADYLKKFEQCAQFWDKHFIDKKYGECYQTLLRDGTPSNRVKGDTYKSAYHSMEQCLLSYLYLNLYVYKTDAVLYFNLSADAAGGKHYVNLVEDPGVIIKSVTIDGKNFSDFKADEGYINLPQGKNMKVKVTFGAK